eukprot:TRINITY_DN48263_c0_g1_i24.p1 TRINITY_DN48263_c0_g1~~TRINITY_DN48263_c0_g1_i24.p1  ORF type:complete len:298 (+),score=-39.38 TRINITY_DN48263_c0_g1_i24:103-996(+)
MCERMQNNIYIYVCTYLRQIIAYICIQILQTNIMLSQDEKRTPIQYIYLQKVSEYRQQNSINMAKYIISKTFKRTLYNICSILQYKYVYLYYIYTHNTVQYKLYMNMYVHQGFYIDTRKIASFLQGSLYSIFNSLSVYIKLKQNYKYVLLYIQQYMNIYYLDIYLYKNTNYCFAVEQSNHLQLSCLQMQNTKLNISQFYCIIIKCIKPLTFFILQYKSDSKEKLKEKAKQIFLIICYRVNSFLRLLIRYPKMFYIYRYVQFLLVIKHIVVKTSESTIVNIVVHILKSTFIKFTCQLV